MRLNDEQRQFRESIARVLGDRLPFDARQKAAKTGHGYSRQLWQTAAELGWLGAGLPEEAGGLGGGVVETAVLFAEAGRHLVTGPYLATLGLAAPALIAAGGPLAHSLLADVATGMTILSFAHAEPAARHEPAFVETRAEKRAGGYRLSGIKCLVPFADAAQHLLVSARTSGRAGEPDGISLLVVPSDTKGLSIQAFRTHDGGRAAEARLDGADLPKAALLGAEGKAFPIIETALDHASAMLAMQAQGSMWAVYEATLAYFKTRKQFGQTLGSFQALQHRLVDVYVKCQLAQSMAEDAVVALGCEDPVERARRVSAAKAYVGEAGRTVGKEGVQLHGGIGMTDDIPAGHHLKQLTAIALTYGDADQHLSRFQRLSAEGGNA